MSATHQIRRGGDDTGKAMAAKLFLGAFVLALAVSCGQEDMPMSLEGVQPSPGGKVVALATIEVDGEPQLVAPTGDRLFVRGFDDMAWHARSAQWPVMIDEAGLGLFDGIERGMRVEKLAPNRYFAAHGGRLWTVATPVEGQPPVLLASEEFPIAADNDDEARRQWNVVRIPESLRERSPRENSRPVARPSLRLTVEGDELFIDDGATVWRKAAGVDEVEFDELEWESISLRGTPLQGQEEGLDDEAKEESERDLLPATLRHFLPARAEDEAEVVTVYRRRLKIYRRGPDDEDFERVSTLDALDRHLVRVRSTREETEPTEEVEETEETTDVMFLVDSDAVHRSDDDGQSWKELAIARDSLAPQDYRQLVVFDDRDSPAGYELWLLGDRGGLWRSGDGGEQWEEAVEHDPDGRGLTGLVAEGDSAMWAATEGRGILRSEDGGDSWEATNRGLRAGSTYDAALVGDGKIFVGTDAGLFERVVDGERRSRDWIDDRATSALYWDHEQERLIRGTVGGGIIVDADGEDEAPELAPLAEDDVIEYLPPHLRGLSPEPAAIVDLVPQPGTTDIIAWSHRRGPLISNDAGASWLRLPLGEAFRNAIEGAVVTQFLGMPDQTYIAVTRSRNLDEPAQLWRSVDGGSTWQATHSFMEGYDETPMQLIRLPGGQGLLRAHGSRLAASTDMGETWTSISGPWDSGQLLGLATDGDQVVVVLELNYTTMIAWLDDPLEGAEIERSHHLIWPSAEVSHRTRPVALDVRDEEILLNEGGRIYSAQTPRKTTEGPAHVSTLIGMGVVLILTTLAFGYLKIWER